MSAKKQPAPRRAGPPTWVRLVFLALIVLTFGGLLLSGNPRELLQRVSGFIEGLGSYAPAALVVLCVVFCLFLIPASVLCLAAGAVFGTGLGFLLIFIGMNLGAAAAFLTGRTVARPWVREKFGAHPWFLALGRAVGEKGFTTVALARLSPAFPFFVLNYLLSLTEISLAAFSTGTALGMIPGTLAVVYLGAVARQSLEGTPRFWWQWLLLLAGAAATVAVVWLVGRRAKQLLRRRLKG